MFCMHSCSIFWRNLFTLADGKKVPLESGKWQLHEYQRRNWQLRREYQWTRGTVVTGTHLLKHRWNCHVKTLNQVWENAVWIGRFESVWGSHNSIWPHRRPSLCRVTLPSVDQTWLQCCHLGPGHSAHCFSHVGAPGRFKGRIRVRMENLLGGSLAGTGLNVSGPSPVYQIFRYFYMSFSFDQSHKSQP